ncbi:MAG: hypothetical protein IPM33_05670 [Phycisphaerales bacterium]|nr:hypothetical protein [Phycisphaerales bacterium]
MSRIPPTPNPAQMQARLEATLGQNLRNRIPLKAPKAPLVARWEEINATSKAAAADAVRLRKSLDLRG